MTEPTSLSDSSITIRQMLYTDVASVVKVHAESFPNFFLTFLGRSFLCELYSAILADQDGISFVATNGREVSGFVAGTGQPAGFYRRLLHQRWWRFAFVAIPSILKRPTIVPRLLRAFAIPEQVTHEDRRGTLMSIAVLPGCQGSGIGHMLVAAFLKAAINRGLRQVGLTTDRLNNEAANRFYQSLGFVCERTYITPEGRSMNEYVIELSPKTTQNQ